MVKLVTVAVVSTVAAAGLVLAAIMATTYVAGDFGFLSTVSAAAIIVGFLALLVALLEHTNRRAHGPAGSALGGGARDDRDVARMLDELRAVGGIAGVAPARHTRLPTM